MSKKIICLHWLRNSTIAVFILLLIGSFSNGCKFFSSPDASSNPFDTIFNYVNWNLHFKGNEDSAGRAVALDSLEAGIARYLHGQAPTAVISFQRRYCPCDSMLTNLSATVIGASSGSVTTPPTKPYPGPSGDFMLSNNQPIEMPDAVREKPTDTLEPLHGDTPVAGQSIAIGVIDTGFDPALFGTNAQKFIWQDSTKSTLYNFLEGANVADMKDETRVKHGSVVSSIIWRSFRQGSKKPSPSIMVLRAFDKDGKGSAFSVSCAMSYAVKHKAALINASWGYFGSIDSVMNHYIVLASEHSIPFIAAAGNTPKNDRTAGLNAVCLDSLNSRNMLTIDRLFFPGGLADTMMNMITVTGLNQKDTPCFYQNYSAKYVTLGVKNKRNCCEFSLDPGGNNKVEGSSFATPVITGRIGAFLSEGAAKRNARLYLDHIGLQTSTHMFTLNGQYIVYSD